MLSMISYAEENGIKRAKKKVKKRVKNRLGALIKYSIKRIKRYSDAEKASEDEVYREQLYKRI